MTMELLHLVHVMSEQGEKRDPKKVALVQKSRVSTNVHKERSFLGFGNYFRKFVQGYSTLVKPLTRNKVVSKWTN